MHELLKQSEIEGFCRRGFRRTSTWGESSRPSSQGSQKPIRRPVIGNVISVGRTSWPHHGLLILQSIAPAIEERMLGSVSTTHHHHSLLTVRCCQDFYAAELMVNCKDAWMPSKRCGDAFVDGHSLNCSGLSSPITRLYTVSKKPDPYDMFK